MHSDRRVRAGRENQCLKGGTVNSSRYYLERFVRDASAAVPAGSLVLDAGAGDGIYRPWFSQHRYESADFEQVDKPYQTSTYVCDLASIPVASERYDLVLLTQVLEHLPEPREVLAELRRVLKPGGLIYVSAPLYYEEHEQPYDYFRYTQFALMRMFSEAGFGAVRIDWLEGYLGTVSYQCQVAARALPKRLGLPLKVVGELFARIDTRYKVTHVGHPKNYTVVAQS
jgi:SAM-dependent methyltransferase